MFDSAVEMKMFYDAADVVAASHLFPTAALGKARQIAIGNHW